MLAAALGAREAWPDAARRLQGAAFDVLQRAAGRPLSDGGPAEVVVVDIDDASLARVGQWPWPRDTVAALIAALQDLGARAIGLDVVFSEPDRTSPRRLAADWAGRYGLGLHRVGGAPEAASDSASGGVPAEPALPDHDDALARAFARGRVVAGFGLVREANGAGRPRAAGLLRRDAGGLDGLPDYRGAVRNLPALERAAADQGAFMVAGEADEIIRRMPLVFRLDGRPLPSLVLSVLRVAQGGTGAEASGAAPGPALLRGLRPGGGNGPPAGYALEVAGRTVPLEADGSMRLRFSRRGPGAAVPAAEILSAARGPATDGEAERLRGRIAGRIVLVGTSALGLVDRRATPFDSFTPGVDIHAGAIEQILRGDTLERPHWAGRVEAGLAALLALAAALLVAAARMRWALAFAAAAAAGIAALTLAAYRAGVLLDAGPPLLLPPLALAAAALARHAVAERDARRLRAAFKQYLSPDLVETLARDPEGLRLGGEEREMTFLFTDLEGFTSFTERVGPGELVATLNAYLDGVCAVAFRHGGTIDKIVGDAVHVMFNAPLDQPDHAARAVACALEVDAFAKGFAAARGFGVTRIGVNTGPAVVGNFGGARRFDYTAHGDAINTAARLEAVNKRFGTTICVSRATVERVRAGVEAGPARFRAVGAALLKGKAAPTELFTAVVASGAALGPDGDLGRYLDRYDAAFAALARLDPAAVDQMLRLHEEDPGDPLAAYHARRLRAGERGPLLGQAA